MSMQRWRPWDQFKDIERHMDNVIRNPFLSLRHPLSWWRVPTDDFAWVPALEIYEKTDNFTIRVELPGMKVEDIDIAILGDTLTIKGDKKASSEVKDEDYHRCEICYGSFARAVTLPAAVRANEVAASYEDGILEVILPKVAGVKPKKIAVKAARAENKGVKPKTGKSVEVHKTARGK